MFRSLAVEQGARKRVVTICQDDGFNRGLLSNRAFDGEAAPVDFGGHALDDDPISTFFRLHSTPPAIM
jgi:hypothetical protein